MRSSGSDKDESQASDNNETIRSDDESDDASSFSDLVTRDSSDDDSSDDDSSYEEEEDESSARLDPDEDEDAPSDLDDEGSERRSDADSQAGADGAGGQAGVAGDGAEPAGVPGPPEDGKTEGDEDQEAQRRVPLLEQPLIVEGQRRRQPATTFTRHNYALDPQGAPAEEVVFQSVGLMGLLPLQRQLQGLFQAQLRIHRLKRRIQGDIHQPPCPALGQVRRPTRG